MKSTVSLRPSMTDCPMIVERPMIFNGVMIPSLLDGTKTQTRRLVKPIPEYNTGCYYWKTKCLCCHAGKWKINPDVIQACPYGKVGDKLWVRETWKPHASHWFNEGGGEEESFSVSYKAGGSRSPEPPHDYCLPDREGWLPSTHMPRWASRILLEITDIRIERLKDITREDAIAEGIEGEPCDQTIAWKDYLNPKQWGFPEWGDDCDTAAIDSYRSLWNMLNAKKGFGWEVNSFVWVIEFKRMITP